MTNQDTPATHHIDPTSASAPVAPARHRWPLLVIGASAGTAVWSGWVGLGELVGFGVVHPLPGIADTITINTAITLPIGVEAYAMYALSVATTTAPITRSARRFAWTSSVGALALGMAGQVAYHLMAADQLTSAPWPIVAAVSCLPVIVLGFASVLWHLAGQTPHNTGTDTTTKATENPDPDPLVTPEEVTTSRRVVPLPSTRVIDVTPSDDPPGHDPLTTPSVTGDPVPVPEVTSHEDQELTHAAGPVVAPSPPAETPSRSPSHVHLVAPVTPEATGSAGPKRRGHRGSGSERVAWAMGQAGVASVGAITTRWGVSESTAKRDRREALALTRESHQDVTPIGDPPGHDPLMTPPVTSDPPPVRSE
jgi:hypothetical protein